MKRKDLTNYDLFLLEKKGIRQSSASDTFVRSAYDEYIVNELCRTEPSATKVMTKEEFDRQAVTEYNKPVSEKIQRTKKPSNIKKFGFIALGLYVIIVIALALIVLMSTNGNNIGPGADASEPEESIIQTMSEEETNEVSEDWFDRFCDSLNKK